jgi:DNA-binding transcriptional regulator/RsmH inhibitor MraZ
VARNGPSWTKVEDSDQQAPRVEPPLGMYPARCDDKGRVKLPADFQQYFADLGEKRFFVTSLDRRIAQIYPISVWRENEKFLLNYRDDPKTAKNVAFNAADLGGKADLDSQGRLLFPAELRRELGIENQPIRLFMYNERVEVLSDAIYEERKRAAQATGPEDVAKLEAAGLK